MKKQPLFVSEEKFKLVLSYLQLISSLEDESNYYKDNNSKEEPDLPTLEELNQQNNILDVLKNRYTGEFVYCRNPEDVLNHGNGYIFYRVFKKEAPDRIYLVNRDAYIIVD